MTEELDELLEKVSAYDPNADIELIRQAYLFANEAHRNQFRSSGEAYILHPLGVAKILAEMELDSVTIAASLLHDVVEDTITTIEEMKELFGPEVGRLVDGVTKLSRLAVKSKQDQQVESLRKMFFAMAKDIRVILIKLADRLHNMRTLKFLPPEKQKKIANETLEIYAPLANRLGISKVKWELEDLSFRFLRPDEYYDLSQKVAKKRGEREGYISDVKENLKEKIAQIGIKAEIQGRPKHFYSIYRKMVKQGIDFSEIYDLTAVRVVVDTVKECYGVLGIVHTLWMPIPGRFKDYIAMPKPNMYQSLHTTVVGPLGEPLEIQIRTFEMHKTAEEGIAAHWQYKEGTKPSNRDMIGKIAWLRQIMEWQNETKNAREFVQALKVDLFEDEVFVFTPKGDVVSLPVASTPIDFAYGIHTEIGQRCVGAKVNGKMVSLDTKLENGDFVEILTSKQSAGPSRDWLHFVKTSKAKNRIRHWFKEERREENINKGRETLEKELRRQGHEVHENLKVDKLSLIGQELGFSDSDDLLAAIGYAKVSAQLVITKLLAEAEDKKDKKSHKEKAETEEQIIAKPTQADSKKLNSQGVRVKGIENILVRFSRCCNPVPGDEIIGYITRGRGVSVHRKDCPNILLLSDVERRIEVDWDSEKNASFPVEIEIEAMDRTHLLADITTIVAETKANILSGQTRVTKSRIAYTNFVLEVKDIEHLNVLLRKVRRVNGVLDVYRVVPR